MMLTFEQLKPVLYYYAHKLESNRHDFWELVSEGWIRCVEKGISDPSFMARKVYFSMVDYLRTVDGRRDSCKSGDSSFKYRTKIHSINNEIRDSDIEGQTFAHLGFPCNDPDVNDMIELIKENVCYNAQERLIISMLADGFLQYEIAEVIGVGFARISQVVKNLKYRILVEYVNDPLVQKLNAKVAS